MTFELIACASLIGAACALAGFFLVLRRGAMLADAISHSVLPGIVAAYFFAGGPNPLAGFAGALAAAMLSSWLIGLLASSKRLKDDAAIGLVFPAMFAIGVLAVSVWFRGVHLDADSVLFGEIVLAPLTRFVVAGVDLGPQAAWIGAGLLALNAAYLAAFRSQLALATFDPEGAQALGARPSLVQYGLTTLVSATAVAAFSAVGAVLAVALLVVPTVAAGLLTKRFPLLLAGLLLGAIACSAGGAWAAIAADLSIAGCIACALGLWLALAGLLSPGRGLVTRALRARRQTARFGAEMLAVHLATHAGSDAEHEESSFIHLVEELGWQPSLAAQAVKEAVRRGAVIQDQGMLRLTDAGRAWAAEASGRRGPVRS